MVAGAQLAANLGGPVRHVPLEALRRDDAPFFERDDADVLAKDVLLGILAHLDVVGARLEQEGQAGAREEVDAAGAVARVRLEAVQVVELAEALVDTAADAAEGNNVDARGVLLSDPRDGLAKVGRVLVGVVDDGGGGRLRRVKVADGWRQGIEVADDDLEIGL